MISLIQLDLDPPDLTARQDDILRWVRDPPEGYMPQTNIGGAFGLWDPNDPTNPWNNQAKPEWGKTIQASEVSAVFPRDYFKANMIRSGLASLREAAQAAGLGDALQSFVLVESHVYEFSFDSPSGYCEPPGWNWDWCMTVPMGTAWLHLSEWMQAGWRFDRTRTVAEALKRAGNRGWPTGWARTRPGNVIQQWTIMPDLRIPACRAWLIGRLREVMEDYGTGRTALTMKTGWLHGDASVRNTPVTPRGADPWLPSPYPGDSYRDACSAMATEMAAEFGGENVIATNTGMNYEPEVPDYCRQRDGGIVAPVQGSWITNMRLNHRWFAS